VFYLCNVLLIIIICCATPAQQEEKEEEEVVLSKVSARRYCNYCTTPRNVN